MKFRFQLKEDGETVFCTSLLHFPVYLETHTHRFYRYIGTAMTGQMQPEEEVGGKRVVWLLRKWGKIQFWNFPQIGIWRFSTSFRVIRFPSSPSTSLYSFSANKTIPTRLCSMEIIEELYLVHRQIGENIIWCVWFNKRNNPERKWKVCGIFFCRWRRSRGIWQMPICQAQKRETIFCGFLVERLLEDVFKSPEYFHS